MCGIAGFAFGGAPVDPAELRRFTDALAHRGPDGSGVFVDGEIGLGHRRLAILDTSHAGDCPLTQQSPDGRSIVVTFNGEIYNFLELRAELQSAGYVFRGSGDTEVAAAALLHWGAAALDRFNGMFAIAAWEPGLRRLLLARDRYGVKPLYLQAGKRLAFASELKAFLTLDNAAPTLNDRIFRLTVQDAGRVEGAEIETLLAGVVQLPAGHLLTLDASGKGGIARWWHPDAHHVDVPARYDDQVAQFREMLFDAVRLRLRSDVPVGTCLSGGVDSSAVAAVMAALHAGRGTNLDRSATDWRHAFVSTAPGSALDETRFARSVAEFVRAEAHYIAFDQHAATSAALDSIWSSESAAGIAATPVWLLNRAIAATGVRVTLDGHGGDEVLGGYTPHLRVPRRELNIYLDGQLTRDVLPGILRNFDRATMAHGIESRMPLLDWRLVTFARALPPDAKIGGGFTKRILRDAVQGLIPEHVRLRRSKVGFNAPLIEWANGPLGAMLRAAMQLPFWMENPYFDGPRLAQEFGTRLSAGPWRYDEWPLLSQLCAMVSLTLWHRQFIEGNRTPLDLEALEHAA